MLKIKDYIRPYGLYMLLTLCVKFFATGMELLIPSLMEVIIDKKVPEGDLRQIYFYGMAMILCAAVALGGNILANRMAAISAGKVTRTLRHDLFARLENLSARQMDGLTISSAESRLTSDTYNVNQLLTRVQRMGVRAPILLIGGILMMLSMDVVLSLVLVLLLPIISLVVYKVTKKTVPLYIHMQSVLDKVVRVCQENITGIRVIKALSKTEYEKARFHQVNEELNTIGLKAGNINNITSPVTTLTLNLGLTLVVVVGAFRVNSGACEPGVIVAFLQYFTMMLTATMGITRIFLMWSKGEASAQRIAEVLETPADLTVLPEAEKETDAPHIEFRNVTFSYTGVGKNLEDLSFRLAHGQTLGILGPTGSGKSTVLNLLLRFYDPDSGTVLIDGQDIRTIPYDTLRKKFGVVFQNDFVAGGSIGENIRFFRDLTEADLVRAAADAQASFIGDKGGLDGQIMVRGNNLSGGQKQRLLISRALAADPEILILDDASSALDYHTDSLLRQALRKNYRSTTTVLVAQRISSLRHADLILVLDDGRVIGAGNHAQLMESCEEYRIIAETQMGDGKEEM